MYMCMCMICPYKHIHMSHNYLLKNVRDINTQCNVKHLHIIFDSPPNLIASSLQLIQSFTDKINSLLVCVFIYIAIYVAY